MEKNKQSRIACRAQRINPHSAPAGKDGIKDLIKKLPAGPGVYLFRDRRGALLYIGKAGSLKKRVASYFRKDKNAGPKIMAMKKQIANIDFAELKSAEEALIVEDRLIKDYQPKYNVELKDDKHYPLIKVTVDEQWPRMMLVRRRGKDDSCYFGPYTDSGALKRVMKLLRRSFKLRSCRTKCPDREDAAHCLYYHLNECLAPCMRKASPLQYQEAVKQVVLLLDGRGDELLKTLRTRMFYHSRHKNYEKAAKVRDLICDLEKVVGSRISKRILKGIPYKPAQVDRQVNELGNDLGLSRAPLWIDAFDVSNLYGKQAVGSLIVFRNGLPCRSKYRRFRIKSVTGIDDYAMMSEIVSRRYRRLLKEKRNLPDLVLIDGGKGHYMSAVKALDRLGAGGVRVIGLAKRFEQVYAPEIVRLPKSSPSLKLLMRIRDEAHRFAVSYHRKLRKKEAGLDG